MATPIVPQDLKARLKTAYDAIAPKYNEWTIPHSEQRMKYLSKLIALLPLSDPSRSFHVLELGCGCGLPVTQKLLSYPNISVTANDLSSTQIELARSNLLGNPEDMAATRLVLKEGDMAALSFPDSSFDAVLGFYSVIHLPLTEQSELLQKISRWLKPGGLFLANFAANEMEGHVMDQWLDDKNGWMFWSGWGEKETLKLAREVGLEVLVAEVQHDVVDDASFLWIMAKKQ